MGAKKALWIEAGNAKQKLWHKTCKELLQEQGRRQEEREKRKREEIALKIEIATSFVSAF